MIDCQRDRGGPRVIKLVCWHLPREVDKEPRLSRGEISETSETVHHSSDFFPGFSHKTRDPAAGRTGSKLDQRPRRVSAALVPWNGSGAISFADHGRWKVDDLRAGSIRGFITAKSLKCDHHQNLYLKLQGFAAFFVCQLLVLLFEAKKLEIPMLWALLWLQGLQVLPVSGPTFGQSCGLPPIAWFWLKLSAAFGLKDLIWVIGHHLLKRLSKNHPQSELGGPDEWWLLVLSYFLWKGGNCPTVFFPGCKIIWGLVGMFDFAGNVNLGGISMNSF